jgi:hypothetical protein
MQEIMALIAYLPMSFRNLFTGIVSSMASSLTTGELALFPFQVGLCFAIIMGVFYRIASRERGKMEQTQIYADCLIGVRKMLPYLFLGNLTRKNDVLLVSLSLHGCSLNGSLYLTMQIDPYLAYFRQGDMLLTERIAALRIGKAIIAVTPLKAWEARDFSSFDTAKESLHRFVESKHYILQHLRMNVLVLFPEFLYLR